MGLTCLELECLHRLKELKADQNCIDSLDGIMGLEKLQKLSLNGNQIKHVDFTSANW